MRSRNEQNLSQYHSDPEQDYSFGANQKYKTTVGASPESNEPWLDDKKKRIGAGFLASLPSLVFSIWGVFATIQDINDGKFHTNHIWMLILVYAILLLPLYFIWFSKSRHAPIVSGILVGFYVFFIYLLSSKLDRYHDLVIMQILLTLLTFGFAYLFGRLAYYAAKERL